MIIREATPEDADLVQSFIVELATYERVLDETTPNVGALRRDLRPNAAPRLFGLIAEIDEIPVGIAIYYLSYSTNRTSWRIHLRDLFVREAYRGRRIGHALFSRLGTIATAEGYDAIEFEMLAWNENARAFYERLGAMVDPGLMNMYIDGDALKKLAE